MRSAIFMDYENIYWSLRNQFNLSPDNATLIHKLKTYSDRVAGGALCSFQAYADFDCTDFSGLLTDFQRRNVEPKHVFSKTYEGGIRKNAADIEMSLDALQMIYERPDITNFVLVCGDRDMIQVIRKLRSHDKTVHVLAVEKTMSKDVASFVHRFTALETLLEIGPAVNDLASVILKLAENEKSKPFVGLKYFLRLLAGSEIVDRRTYEVVNRAISEGMIETYKIPNPKDELYPTTACRVDPNHEQVRRILACSGEQLPVERALG